MPRTVKEWIGKTDDSKIPPRVCDRVFDAHDGVCHWCKIKIKIPIESWQTDHVISLINGGENRETNLAPIHSPCHIEKTGIDVKAKAKLAKVRQHHRGIRPVAKMKSRPHPISERTAKNKARERRRLQPKKLFEAVR